MNPDPREAGQTERACPEGVLPERVTVAVVGKPQGRHGEVLAQILTDFPERLLKRRQVFLWNGNPAAPGQPATITRGWFHKGRIVLQFEGCTTRADAEKLRGWHVQIPKAERVELPAGSHYISDLIGCEVFEETAEGAKTLGRVCDVIPTGENLAGPHLLKVETREGAILIPLAQEICPVVDVAARRIEVVLPEGLKDANRFSIRQSGPRRPRRKSRD